MRCDFGRSTLLRFGWALPMAMLLVAAAAAPVKARQEQDRSAAPQQPQENPIDRWNRMSPEERERQLAKLPPARAKMIRQRIWRYNHLHPAEQQALRQRYQTFSQLPPDQQQIVRERLREFRQLPVARQTAVHREVERLRLSPENQRQAHLNGDDFRSRFSPQEQQIVMDLLTYFPE